jgi:hypothetical protein
MRKLLNSNLVILLLLILFISCHKKRYVKITTKTASGVPVANQACGASDDYSQTEVAVAHTNSQGEAILEISKNKNHTIRIWCNTCSGGWEGEVRDTPTLVQFTCP